MKELKYLVTGTGRSGTVFMARLLTSVDILCGHETIFDFNGPEIAKKRLNEEQELKLSVCSGMKFDHKTNTHTAIDWHPNIQSIIADSSYMAAPFLNEDILANTTVIHVVRNPVNVINSFCNSIDYFCPVSASPETEKYENFICTYIPLLREAMPQYDKAALYYILWNEMIEKSNPDIFFRIEDDPRLLLEKLGFPAEQPYFCDTSVNTFERIRLEQFDCSKIKIKSVRNRLCEFAEKYGYKVRPCMFI